MTAASTRAPSTSYIVWHTQRTGSTLLCTTLDATNVAGHPDEWPEEKLRHSRDSVTTIRDALWSRQSTSNGVLGVKWSYHQPSIDDFCRMFCHDGPGGWEAVFPGCRHIVMTRRNKIRLAVSWWKAICGGRYHQSRSGAPLPWQDRLTAEPDDLVDAYDFAAIKRLVFEVVEREAALQELLSELEVSPLSVTYEDFIADYEQTIRRVLAFLGLGQLVSEVPPPLLARTSDDVNDRWVTRFLSDLGSD